MSSHAWALAEGTLRRERHFGDREGWCFAQRPASLAQMLREAVQRAPHGDAVVDAHRRLNWTQFTHLSLRVAGALRVRGLQAGERVILLLGNRAEFTLAAAALAHLGAVAVPVSVRSAAPEVAYVATQCGARGIVYDDALAHLVPPPAGAPTLTLRVPLADWPALEAGPTLEVAAAVETAEEDVATLLYTSGTTGRPKGAMLTHFNIVHSVLHFEACMGLRDGERTLIAVPLSHVTGLVAQWWQAVRCAGTAVLLDGFKAEAALALAARERITHSVMVPAMYQLCLMHDAFAKHDLSAWRVGAYGGAPMPPATVQALAERLPSLTPTNCYGATETTSPATVMPPGAGTERADSVGIAVPCGELSIRDAQGQLLPHGSVGEVWIRGPMVVKGYWGNEAAAREAITEGWWHSGDLGRLDEAGHLQVLDRIKDVINRGGYKVFCNEVEAVLAQHPAVAEAAVLGFACPVLGERVRAVVCLREAASDAAALQSELKAWCARQIADYKVPEHWHIATLPLPRNANGKVMKRSLREGFQAP